MQYKRNASMMKKIIKSSDNKLCKHVYKYRKPCPNSTLNSTHIDSSAMSTHNPKLLKWCSLNWRTPLHDDKLPLPFTHRPKLRYSLLKAATTHTFEFDQWGLSTYTFSLFIPTKAAKPLPTQAQIRMIQH